MGKSQSKVEEVIVNNNGPQINKSNDKYEYGIDVASIIIIIIIIFLFKYIRDLIVRKFNKAIRKEIVKNNITRRMSV